MSKGIVVIPPPPPVHNPLITLISSHSHTLTRTFRLVMRIQSARLSSFHTPTVCYMGQTGVMSSYRLINCQDEIKSCYRSWLKCQVCGCVCCDKGTNTDLFVRGLSFLFWLRCTHTYAVVLQLLLGTLHRLKYIFWRLNLTITLTKQNLTLTLDQIFKWMIYCFWGLAFCPHKWGKCAHTSTHIVSNFAAVIYTHVLITRKPGSQSILRLREDQVCTVKRKAKWKMFYFLFFFCRANPEARTFLIRSCITLIWSRQTTLDCSSWTQNKSQWVTSGKTLLLSEYSTSWSTPVFMLFFFLALAGHVQAYKERDPR